LIVVAVTASAQETVDAKQVVGTWMGTVRATGNAPASVQVEFKPEGLFEGGAVSSVTGHVVDYIADSSRGKAEASWTMKLDGEELSGTGFRPIGNLRFDVNLKRVK
jgi:hypothetical protein